MNTKNIMIDTIKILKSYDIYNFKIMEVCGSHTEAIGKLGIRNILTPQISLVSGPGCPVCVTPESYIDAAVELLQRENIILATFGDLMKVKGSKSNLILEREKGKKIKVIYSPLEAIKIAEENKNSEVVFLAVGFETTAPLIALTIKKAKTDEINNLSFLVALKTMKPVLEYILQDKNHRIDGLICPGHVATIKGANYFKFITEKYNIPAVISGFQPLDILSSIYFLAGERNKKKKEFRNLYKTCVKEDGNKIAKEIISEIFSDSDSNWRGIGTIKKSGLSINDKYIKYDALKKFNINTHECKTTSNCMCSEIILGKKLPNECALFSKECTPENPKGPCMVSKEGSCSIFYKYKNINKKGE